MSTTSTSTDVPTSEALSTAALFLNIAAVIALVLCLGALTAGEFATMAIAGVIAVISFAASLACFAADERRSREAVIA